MILKGQADYFLRGRPQHAVVHLTTRCNLRCSHCFVDQSESHDLGPELLAGLARDLGPITWLDVSGGEPLLRPDMAQVVSRFQARVIQIPTNGTLGTAAVEQVSRLRELTPAEVVISISLDGLEATHDAVRGRTGTWQKAWETFRRLRELPGLPVKVNTVLTKYNQDEILACMDQVLAQRPDFHSVILVRGLANQVSELLPSFEDLDRLGPAILAGQAKYDYGKGLLASHMLRNYHRYLWQLSLRALRRRRQPIPCLGGRAHLVVWADGSVAPCELLPPVGNLRQRGLKDILASPEWRQAVEDIRAGHCWCTHNCALLDSVLFRSASLGPLLWGPRGGKTA